MAPRRAGRISRCCPAKTVSNSLRVTQRAASISAGSTEIYSLIASPRQPIIRDAGKGQGWLAR